MKNYIYTLLFSLEIVSCLVGLLFYRKFRGSIWGLFPAYLVFVVLAELTGTYLANHYPLQVNTNFFSYFEIPVEFLFFFTLFFLRDRVKSFFTLPVICGLIYIGCWLVDILYIKKYKFIYSFSYMIGSVLMLILVLRYFVRLVTSDDIINFSKDMMFWVSMGLLLFYLGSFPYYGLVNTMSTHHELIMTFKNLSDFFDCLMYIMFTLGFIWARPST